MRKLHVFLVLGLVAVLIPARSSVVGAAECPTVDPPELAFDEPLYIDRTRAGGEPVSVVAHDGSISVSAHAGTTHIYKDPEGVAGVRDFAVGYTNQTLNWRSEDGGRTWEYVGIPLLREGPHSATSTGFSDPDYAIDAGGRIYNVEIDLANVAVFSSLDDGQSYTVAHPMVTAGDRPWLTAGDEDEVFLYVNLPKQLWRSTDGGLTWDLVSTSFPVNSKIYNDPRNFETGLIGPVGKNGIAISDDDGQTWTTHSGADLGKDANFFGVMAVDSAGHAYKAAAGGYRGSSDNEPDGQVTFNYFDRDAEEWGAPVELDTPDGDALWPWLTAGDEDRVAITWYQTHADDPEAFYIYVAYTTNARGTTVTCDDGSTKFIPPQFTVVNASGRPIHEGAICLAGTACNWNYGTDYERGDRRLGDFFTINHDAEGNIMIASGDTMLKNPAGGPKPVGNPIFIRQSAGPKMLDEPMETRETRCLFPLPSC